MSDDAELRSRIEAQLAARRADPVSAPAPASERNGSGSASDADDLLSTASARPLTPTRPWARTSDEAVEPVPESPTKSSSRFAPARPWLDDRSGSATATNGTTTNAANGTATNETAPNGAGSSGLTSHESRPISGPRTLAPVRPWATREPTTSTPAAEGSRAPSNPGIVLPQPAADSAVAESTEEQSQPDLPAPRRPAPRARPVPSEPATRPADGPAGADLYPWQERERVDLDLQGAPTWDPAQYPPEPADANGAGRSGRALRWLLARSPETPGTDAAAANGAEPTLPQPEPAAPIAEPAPLPAAAPTPPPGASRPGEDLARRLAAANAARTPVPADSESADGESATAEKRPGRRLRWRRRDDDDDVDDEPLVLPEPDAAFATSWTRTAVAAPIWGERAESATGAIAPTVAPTESETAGAAPATVPVSVPVTEQPEEPIRRARPRPRPTAAPVPDEPAPPIRLGIAGASSRPAPVAAAEPGPRPRPAPPTGIAGASSISDTDEDIAEQKRHADLSRFLASEPRAADDADVAKPQVRKRFGGRWWRIAIRVAIVIVIAGTAAFLLRTFVVAPYYIPSASMEPTLHGCSGCTKDHVLVDKLSYRSHDPHQGDIVVFHRPADAVGLGVSDKVLIKRVIGQEGDHVLIKNGHVYLNGATVPIDEPYVNKSCGPRPTLPLTETSSWTVPDNDVFVMGDNRCDSTDSRVFGPIPKSSIIGRAFAIVWPISRMRLLDGG